MAESNNAVAPGRAAIGLAVLGVVYGDIGTSPIYALRECFRGISTVAVSEANVLGILSLIFWALILVTSLKYMAFVLRANNHGEGGIFALLALLRPGEKQNRLTRRSLILFGLFGAALLYGDSMITPAISVLSAVEGLEVAAPEVKRYVVPITIGILVGLFVFQKRGTAGVGAAFGPVMILWFGTLAVLGLAAIASHPSVLRALAPNYAGWFLLNNGWIGFLVLSGVFLVVTGSEALYADLGHFGAGPIRAVWFFFVLPALVINYFGQGAELLENPAAVAQPFFHLAPAWALYPLVILATAATVIASQAVITGTYSLSRQAVQLGMIPRLYIRQTSEHAHGQIYVPAVNWILMIAACALVGTFGSSSDLAAAYGLSVNATMLVTTVLAFNVARELGGWSRMQAALFLIGFISVDIAFLVANGEKIPDGGWFPLVMGAVIFTIMVTWRRGEDLLLQHFEANAMTVETLLGRLENDPPYRSPGVGVFFTARAEEVPRALQQLIKRTRTLPEKVVIINLRVMRMPHIALDERIEVKKFKEGLFEVNLRYGFMQGFNIPSDLALCVKRGELAIDMEEATYYVGRTSIIAARKKNGMMAWRDRLYAFLKRNTMHQTSHFQIPVDRMVEIGLHLGI